MDRWAFAPLWDASLKYERFVREAADAHRGFWESIHRLARVPAWAVEEMRGLPGRFRLVILAEDWCGDAVNTVPVLARWAETAPNLELRILRRDEHPEVMDGYLTGGAARSIPVVVCLTDAMEELGWWGPRPAALQALVMAQRRAGMDKRAIYAEERRWYSKDKGETALREVLAILERVRAGSAAQGLGA